MAASIFFAAFGASLAVLCVVERVAHAVLSLAFGKADLRAGLLIGSTLNFATVLWSTAVAFFVRCAGFIGWLVFWYALFYVITAFWYVLYEDQPDVVIFVADFYTKRVGPFLHGFLFVPLDLLNLVLKAILPVYNALVWVLRGLLTKGLLPVVWDELDLLVDFCVALLGLGKSLSVSVVEFVVGAWSCEDLSCVERPAVLDLVSPLGNVRDMAIVSSRVGGVLCSTVALPLDWALYPLVDARFARGLHALANSVLHLALHVPRAARQRCEAYAGNGSHTDALMCTPDLEPAFERAVTGVRELGGAVDNWMGVGAAMARRSLTGLPDDCAPRTLGPERFRGELLGGLQATVGLTDWLLAAANGTRAYFWGQVTTDTAWRDWPEPVDVRMGLAAVAFDEAGEVEISGVTQGQRPSARQTTSLLGCRCVDTDGGVVVRCAVLPLHGEAAKETHAFDVLFQDRTWSAGMECRAAEVSVRSVRWPVRRYEGKSVPYSAGFLDLPESDCATRGTCESVDATIWLVPRCDLLRPEQCSDAAVGTSCFPFCMAARVSGSRNANPVFVNAETWRGGKQLLMRDCALQAAAAAAGNSLAFSGATVATAGYAQTTLYGAAGGAEIFVSGSGDGSGCLAGPNLASWVPSNRSAGDPRSVPAYVRRRGQPFAVAGDAALIEFAMSDGSSTVEVDRLSGNQRDVFALVPGWAGLPTAPKFLVPAAELTSEERSRVVVPLDFVSTRVPATSSRNYVFYAVSPDLRIFQAYLDYCRDPSKLPQAAFMMQSSYSALRVYRVRAYCQETCEAGDLAAQFTFDGFSDGKFSAAEFPQDCSRVYNASVDALEYVNEQNLAVTVQVADRTYDPLLRSGANSTYATYWLNPQTMRARRGEMWPAELPSTLTAGLCLAGDGVPHLGTLGAELGAAALHLLHRGVGVLLYAPGMLEFWRGGAACPLESRGHSVLASCGQSYLGLDDFFDSLDSAAAVFWGIPGWAAEQMQQGKPVDYSPVGDLLRGFGAYGRGTVGVDGVQRGVMTLLNTPLPEEISGVFALARQPGAIAGAAKVVGAASSWARFTTRFFAEVGAKAAERLTAGGSLDLGELWRDAVNTLYDQRPLFKSTVTDRGVAACLGLEVMVGGANPVGKVLYQSCQSSVRLLDGAMDVFLHAFADAPMVKCVCKDSEGRRVAPYARGNCVWKAPKTMQPTLLGMISASEGLIGGDSLLCPAVIAYTRRSLERTMSPYFASVYSSLDALGDSVDYLLSGFDADAGQCSDFRADPQVVVIMPEPVDYFRGCGATTYCRTKCAGNWEAFDAARAAYDPSRLTTSRELGRSVDSLFFPSVVPDMIAPGNVVALSEPDACGDWVCRDARDGCLAVAAVVGLELRVVYYCVPSAPAETVYASDRQGIAWSSSAGHNASKVSFLASDGSALAALVGGRVVLLQRGAEAKVVLDPALILSLPLVGMYPLRVVDFMAVRHRLLVSVAVRTASEGKFERGLATLWLDPTNVTDIYADMSDVPPASTLVPEVEERWRRYNHDLFPPVVLGQEFRDMFRGYASAEYPSDSVGSGVLLLWPTTALGSVMRLALTWTDSTVEGRLEPVEQSQSLVARATLMPRQLVLAKTLREDLASGQLLVYASAGNVYDWLRQLRLSGAGLRLTSASLSNSQPVPATIGVNTSCDGLDCRGCPDLALRSLCSAYQSCAVFRCIGTPVNLKRPLCGVGQALRSVGNMGVANVQGAWVMFVDLFMILLQLKTAGNLPGVDVSFPDDAFLGNMCAAKDVSAEFFSILTATVNSVLQKAQSVAGRLSPFGAVDSNVNTMVSMSMAAVTGFLHQIALAPVYVLSVGHKVMMCQVSGFLAVTSATGTRVNIQPARFSSTDAISGQCLTVGAEVNAQQTGDRQAERGVASHAAEILTSGGQAAVMRRLEPYMHMVDGGLTYLIGVTAKLADVLQATDVQHCVLPDVTLRQTVRCACGDQPLQILQERAEEKLADFAYWCTGSISLVDGENRVRVVWNPYSYAELQALVGDKLDAYAAAASSSHGAVPPQDPVFQAQGVSLLAVLTRCRQNYVSKQWDPAAFARYDSAVMSREVRGASFALGSASDGVGKCLLDSAARGAGNGACLDSFLRGRGGSALYWGYTVADQGVPSQLLDACLVFSGPAANRAATDQRRRPFQDCLGGYANESACDLSGFVWSPSSANDVPVAVRHPVHAGANGTHLRDAVERRMQQASERVMEKLLALADYSNDQLRAALFSAEGDVIHQLMDCVFMGPYARVDYWPAPRCDESERDDCLVGPYWSRDSGKGKSRGVDLDTCDAAGEVPFTCGSPTRKAMVRDFVRQYLETGAGGAEIVAQLVRDWVQNLTLTWADPERFLCGCEGCDCDGYLPRNLSGISLQLSTRGIMNALGQRLQIFYRAAMQVPEPWIAELEQAEMDKYDWRASGGAHQVPLHAAFHPSEPTMRYDASEAAGPPVTPLDPSLWRACHSALKQVLFTMPVQEGGALSGEFPAFSGGGLRDIAEHVRALVRGARESSPLFRHYQPRHHPSSSRMCSGSAGRDAREARGAVRFSNYTVGGNVVFDGSAVPPIPALAYDAAVLGGAWHGSVAGLTEHLGFLGRDATEQWLRGQLDLTTDAETLLRYGPGGLKVGNLPGASSNLSLPEGFAADLDAVLREQASEADRAHPVESAALHGCGEHAKAGADLLGEFVDGLFPMAQGVRESGVGSYCLRFAVELALLYAMELEPSLEVAELVAQKDLAASWRRKCGAQVQLVGMCSALDLYHASGLQAGACLMQWSVQREPGVEIYLTPECLVKVGSSFYDPCQCRPDWCEPRNSTLVIRRSDLEGDACRLRFDPRSVVQAAEMGWWAEDDPDPAAAAWNAWLEDPVNLLDLPAFRESVLADGQAVGNAPLGKHWATAEGFMNETGLFCDMVADYWPEDALFPVGYHVTTPCHQDDAGYRTFDNVFALEYAPDGSPRLAYLEDQTRDAELVDSHFGAGGLCRGVNFAVDMYETNTMRVCTRLTDGEDVDVHVPRGNIKELGLGLPRCSESSTELPWADSTFYDYYDAAFYSVGTVPNLPRESAALYPESGERYMHLGPQHAMRQEGWGDACQDFSIPNCSAGAWECPEGFVCRPPGVCLHPSVECTRHSECSGGQMCSGVGTCEAPRLSVLNELGEDVSVRAHTTSCAGEAFSMRGASYWGYVPDLLEAHGMCSYRHWQEYRYTMDKCACASQDSSACQLKAGSCPFYTFSRQQITNKWWNDTDNAPTRLKMLPTTCDRDYERFQLNGEQMQACVPDKGRRWIVSPDGAYQQEAERDPVWRLYDEATKTVSVRLMPYRQTRPGVGFLGVSDIGNIKSCMSVQQCYVDQFYKNGRLAMTTTASGVAMADRRLLSGALYDPDDQFRCGVIGHYDAARRKCAVDAKLFPLYYVLCKESPRTGYGICKSSLKQNAVPARCDAVREEYDPEYSVINDVNVPALNEFFYVFSQPSTLSEHLAMVECVEYVYSVVSKPAAQGGLFDSKGLYVPFAFTLYEIPFAWWYQCMLGSSMTVPLALDNKLFQCRFYGNRRELSSPRDAYYNDFRSYIFNVRGGYKRSLLEQAVTAQLDAARAAWASAVEDLRASLFTTPGVDLTYPRCYGTLEWDLPSSNRYKRKIIEAFVRNTCSSNVLKNYLDAFNRESGSSYTAETVVSVLTRMTGLVDQGTPLLDNRLLTGLIKKFGEEKLADRARVSNIVVSDTPVRLDVNMPAASDVEFQLRRTQWKQIGNILPNARDVRVAELPACSQLKNVYDDGKGGVLAEEDTDRQAGYDSTVQACSVYATGFFSCFYPALPIGGQSLEMLGNSTALEQQFDAYVDALYTEVRKRYNQKIAALQAAGAVAPIAMHALNFYQDEASLGFGASWQFDLTGVANYLNNINPDVRTPVMCVAGNQQVNFNRCSDPNFAALKDHVAHEYSKDGGIVVPDQRQLDWDVDSAMLSAGAILSFSSAQRNVSKQFLKRLFDDDSVCGASATTSSRDRLCYLQVTGSVGETNVIAPWLGGWWNPYDQCDVDQLDLQSGNAETVDSLCYFNEYCPLDRGRDVTLPYYRDMPNQQCKERDNERTAHMNINPRFTYNLCRHRLNEDPVCNHTQGMLGGSDGQPSEDYDVGGNLFTLHDFPGEPEGSGSVFRSTLLAGGEVDYGFLRVGPDQIGGHHVGARVLPDGTMRVHKAPLKPPAPRSRMETWDTAEAGAWLPQWEAGVAADDLAYQAASRDVEFERGVDARGKPLLGWDCPLRRRAFYGADVDNFKPSLPSSRRSRRLFGALTGDRWAHPAQPRQDGSARLGKYRTTNGFCFCPTAEEVWPGMCSVDVRLRDEHNCTLYSTVQALRGARWGWSHTFRPRNRQNEFKTCAVQVDWPFVEGKLRDNATLGHDDVSEGAWAEASDVEARRCHVLDRAPDFAYAYVSRRQLRRSGFHTLQLGVCGAGRAQRRHASSSRCVRVYKNAARSGLRCVDNTEAEVERPVSKTPAESASLSKLYRRPCGKCTRPPRFYTRGGHEIPAESSFGLHYRVSAERAIAADLRRALCKNQTACDSVLNASAWRAGEFLPALLRKPELLFARFQERQQISRPYEPRPDLMPDDSKLWARKWVYCPTREALRTGVGCNGTISKSRWRANKVPVCYSTILESLADGRDPFAATDICNLDARLGDLCKAVREAQSVVASANCLRSGDPKCALQEFVYNPSTWETTNQAFVHQTVREYYSRIDGCTQESECICPADPTFLQLQANNSHILRECKAVPVMAFREVLVQVRGMVFIVCKIASLLIDIAFNLVLSISSSNRERATSSIVLSWAQLKQESSVLMDKMSDLFFDMIFSVGNLGPWLKRNIMSACGVVNSAYVYAADFWCNLVVQQLPMFLGALRSIGGWTEVGFSIVNDVFLVILDDQLPNAVMDLYQYGYREYFQSSRYKEKQAAYEERKQIALENKKEPKTKGKKKNSEAYNKLIQNLGDARSKRLDNLKKSSALNLAGALGKVGGVFDVAITGYQTYNMIKSAIQLKEMLDKFPTEFTLFDYDDFFLAIDAFVEFLNADFTCYSMSVNVTPLQCTLLNFTEPTLDDVMVMAPRASACWAEAQQRQVGVSNLFACTPTSTCCSDALNCDDDAGGVRQCSECPLPAAGVRTYGCNTMIQRCQCGVESYAVDRCAAQRDCGPTASCSLLTSLDDVSFGSLRTCTECATSPICLMGSSQQFGQCSCLASADAKVDLCDAPIGAPVNPSISRLCGFARDPGGYYAWAELSLVMCANAVRPVCAEVISETGSVFYMSVSTRIRGGQVAYSSRRLLSVEDFANASLHVRVPSALLPEDPADDVTPEIVHGAIMDLEWNHTSAPCSALAHAYRSGERLGPVDEAALHACVYWRTVARQLVQEHGLQSLAAADTFLLSASDFAASLGQRGVLEELLRKPWVLFHALLYSPWVKPVRAAVVASHDANVSALLRGWSAELARRARARAKKTVAEDARDIEEELERDLDLPNSTLESLGGRRRLLGLWEDTRDRLRSFPFYSLVRAAVANVSLPVSRATTEQQLWLVDAFVWKGVRFEGSCPIASSLASLVRQAVGVCGDYYAHLAELNTPPLVRKRFREILPAAPKASVSLPSPSRPQIFGWILDSLGFSLDDARTFLSEPCPRKDCIKDNKWTASYIAESALFCDLESVMFCSAHRNDLVMSTVFMVLVYVAVSLLCGYLGLYGVSTAFFLAIPVLAVWYSLGVSPRCFPMVPTCLLDDVIAALKGLFPVRAVLPPLLVVGPRELRSCSELNFTSWEDPLAFAACDLGFCDGLDDTKFLGVSRWDFRQMRERAYSPDADAYRVCASVTSTYTIPVVLAAGFVVAVAAALALSAIALAGPCVNILWQVVLYNHAGKNRDI